MNESERDFLDERKRLADALVGTMTERDQLLRDLFDSAHYNVGHQEITVLDAGGKLWARLRAAVGE